MRNRFIQVGMISASLVVLGAVSQNSKADQPPVLSAQITAKIDAILQAAIAQVPAISATVIALDQEAPVTLYEKTFGISRIDADGTTWPADNNGIYRAASISKSMVSLNLKHQLSRHGLDWNAKLLDLQVPVALKLKHMLVNGELKDPDYWQQVTLFQLATHTSGIDNEAYGRDRWGSYKLLTETGRAMNDEEMNESLKNTRFPFPPGQIPEQNGIHYSNLGYNILNRVVGGFTCSVGDDDSERFQNYVREKIFSPLNISGDAMYNFARDLAVIRQHVINGFGGAGANDSSQPGEVSLNSQNRLEIPVLYEPNSYSGSAGIAFSVSGMNGYLTEQLRTMIGLKNVFELSQDEYLDLLKPNAPLPFGDVLAYAKGFYWSKIGDRMSFGHMGLDSAYVSEFAIIPDTGIAIGVLASAGDANSQAYVNQIYNLVADEVAQKTHYTRPAQFAALESQAQKIMGDYVPFSAPSKPELSATIPQQFASLVGNYDSRILGPMQIGVTREGSLAFTANGQVVPLAQTGPDLFQLPNYLFEALETVRFTRDSTGGVAGLYYNNAYYYDRVAATNAAHRKQPMRTRGRSAVPVVF